MLALQRKNKAFQNDVLTGSILESAVDAAGNAACQAKQFVERRSMVADFRAKAATADGRYPLFSGLRRFRCRAI